MSTSTLLSSIDAMICSKDPLNCIKINSIVNKVCLIMGVYETYDNFIIDKSTLSDIKSVLECPIKAYKSFDDIDLYMIAIRYMTGGNEPQYDDSLNSNILSYYEKVKLALKGSDSVTYISGNTPKGQ
jgi:hypothetical protein